MLSAVAIVPSAPVMVPELAAGAAPELADLLAAVFAAADSLPARWLAIGVGSTDAFFAPDRVGTFAGYGVDVWVSLSRMPAAGSASLTGSTREIIALVAEGLSNREIADRLSMSVRSVEGHLYRVAQRTDLRPDPAEPAELPLCALIAGWVRGRVNGDARVSVQVCAGSQDADAAVARGRQLRAGIDESRDPVGVLVVADGANTLTPPAPGGYDPESIPVQAALDDALASGDADALTRLPDTIVGRVAYQVLAGLMPTPQTAVQLYRGAPYGVGYFVGTWQP